VKNRLRQLRVEAGITQRELAKRSGIPDSTIARIDATPSAAISLEAARRIADVLHVDPFDLLPSARQPMPSYAT
jgi:transcriptional regulator with XRE-family HTH domain